MAFVRTLARAEALAGRSFDRPGPTVALSILVAACARDPSPPGADLSFDDVRLWSMPAEAVPQHHATIAFLPDDGLAVTWTEGEIDADPHAWLQLTGDDGVPRGTPVLLADGANAAKTDVEADADGRLWIAWQTPADGIWLERRDDDAVARAQIAAESSSWGNNSVDLAVLPGGGADLVWYADLSLDPIPPGEFHLQQVDDDLAPVPGLPAAFGAIDSAEAELPPDIAAAPDGSAIVAWSSQDDPAYPPDALELARYAPDAGASWQLELDRLDGVPPRRPTVGSDSLGRTSVTWRRYLVDDLTTSRSFFAAIGADGTVLTPAREFSGVPADEPVLAPLGDDAVLLAWSAWLADESAWSVWATVVSFPDGAMRVDPVRLGGQSPEGVFRPHASAVERAPGVWAVAVSWETDEDGGQRVIRGRTGTFTE